MDDVVYDNDEANNDNTVANIEIVRGAPTGTINWLIVHHWVKNAKQAQIFLVAVAITSVLVAVMIQLLGSAAVPPPPTPTNDPTFPKPLST